MSKATTVVHWPGKDELACEEHSRGLQNLGAHLGFPVSVTPYVGEDVECANCVNEAALQDEGAPEDEDDILG